MKNSLLQDMTQNTLATSMIRLKQVEDRKKELDTLFQRLDEEDRDKVLLHRYSNIRYENDGYPPDIPGVSIFKVTYPSECWGCGFKKGVTKCPYCGSY